MRLSLYRRDSRRTIHRGAIYRFRPVFWLEPPLYILRHIQWVSPRHADLYRRAELQNDFKVAEFGNEENVVARAKVRSVVVLSNDYEANDPNVKELIIAPAYTLKPEMTPESLKRLRQNQHPVTFYLPHDPGFPELPEGYVVYRNIQPLKKGFLTAKMKYSFSLTPRAMEALLERYRNYLSVSAG